MRMGSLRERDAGASAGKLRMSAAELEPAGMSNSSGRAGAGAPMMPTSSICLLRQSMPRELITAAGARREY